MFVGSSDNLWIEGYWTVKELFRAPIWREFKSEQGAIEMLSHATVTHVFPLSAVDLWNRIGDFYDTGKWSGRPPEACVAEGDGIGGLRTLTVQDGRVVVDRLEALGDLYYSYSIVRSPLPVKFYRATMSVAPLTEDICTFTWSGVFEPQGISEAEALAFFEGVYRSGIAMMNRTFGLR